MIAETVATPLEEQINGVENMLYMFSQASQRRHADADRHLQARHRPESRRSSWCRTASTRRCRACREVTQQLGVTTVKSSPDLTMVVHLISPDDRYDMLYLRNYAVLNVKDQLAQDPGRRRRRSSSARATTPCASGSTRRRSPSAA